MSSKDEYMMVRCPNRCKKKIKIPLVQLEHDKEVPEHLRFPMKYIPEKDNQIYCKECGRRVLPYGEMKVF